VAHFPKNCRKLIAWALRISVATAGSAGAGCTPGVVSDLQGRWLGQGVDQMPDEQVASATGWARGMSFELVGDNLTVAIPSQAPRTAPFKVESVNDREVRLAVQRDDGKTDYVELTVEDEHTMRWHIGSGMSLVLNKEKS
jgi:hypothetical protein